MGYSYQKFGLDAKGTQRMSVGSTALDVDGREAVIK